jgi:hypothetical protein
MSLREKKMIILKFENRDSKEPVTFQTPICLMNPQGYFLSFNSMGNVKFDKNSGFDQFDSSIAKLTKWIIVDAKNTKSNSIVTPFDDVLLRSPFGQYLQIVNTVDFSIGTGGGMEPNEMAVFRVVKATIPYLPDWLFKRPHLNHNSITH